MKALLLHGGLHGTQEHLRFGSLRRRDCGGKGAKIRITFADARKGSAELDVTDEEAEELARKGRKTARRGRRPKHKRSSFDQRSPVGRRAVQRDRLDAGRKRLPLEELYAPGWSGARTCAMEPFWNPRVAANGGVLEVDLEVRLALNGGFGRHGDGWRTLPPLHTREVAGSIPAAPIPALFAQADFAWLSHPGSCDPGRSSDPVPDRCRIGSGAVRARQKALVSTPSRPRPGPGRAAWRPAPRGQDPGAGEHQEQRERHLRLAGVVDTELVAVAGVPAQRGPLEHRRVFSGE